MTSEKPDEEQDDDDEGEHSTTDVHRISFRSLGFPVVPRSPLQETAFAGEPEPGTGSP
jgi:hypothetical protein